jgi:peptide/nickel transport system substrate-binding protein
MRPGKLLWRVALCVAALACAGAIAVAEGTKEESPKGSSTPGAFSVPNMEAYANAKREETLIIDAQSARLETPDNWNPLVPGNAAGFGLSTYGRAPILLLSYGTGKIENYMAESITSNKEGTVWTLKLRKGITWSDGAPFTIDDVIYSIEVQKATKGLGNYGVYNEWVQEFRRIDDLTADIVLKKPNVRFALERWADNLCGIDWFVPKHIWSKVADPLTFKNIDLKAGLPLTTGPYVLYKLTTNEAIWVRNDNWWAAKIGLKKLPEPKRIIHAYVGTEEVRVATGIDNGFDCVQDITLSSFQTLVARNKNWQSFQPKMPYVWPDPCSRSLSVNHAVQPWDDKAMRWMLSNVMDRQQIIDVSYEGTSIAGPLFWPLYPSMQKYTDLLDKAKLDWMMKPHLDEAEKTLKAKGYAKVGKYWTKDGKTLGLDIQAYEGLSELERIADVYIEQLQRFGIDAKKTRLIAGTWSDNQSLGKYEAQSGWQTCGSILEPYNTLRTMLGTDGVAKIGERPSGRQNIWRYNNPKYNEIVDKLGTLPMDDPQLMVLAKQAYDILYDDLPVIPTAQSKKLTPFNNTYWTNWPSIDNYYQRPVVWCPSFIAVLTEIRSTKK